VEVCIVSDLSLFVRSLLSSWMVWAGGILRVIPFIESFIEPWLRRKYPRVDAWFVARGNDLKKNLKVIAVACLLIGCYRAWVFEHKNAEAAMYGKDGKTEAWARFNQCDKELAIKSVLADTYSGQIADQRSRLDGQQQVFNQCIVTLGSVSKPERLIVNGYFIGVLHDELKNSPDHVGNWVVATNRSVSPVQLLVQCGGVITSASAMILGTGTMATGGWGGKFSDHKYGLSINSPPWTPTNPLLVTIHAPAANIGNCEFTEQ
jgi:hypothetical protein